MCYKCESKYYVIRKGQNGYSGFERSQFGEKSITAAANIDTGQITRNSRTIAKEKAAELFPAFLDNEAECRSPDFHWSKKSNSLLQNDTLQDIDFFGEKQANQISALLTRIDNLEQALRLHRNLRESDFGLSWSSDLKQAIPNQHIDGKADKKLIISKEFEIKDSQTVTLNLCLNIDGKLSIE